MASRITIYDSFLPFNFTARHMPILIGSHLSVAGGCHRAAEEAGKLGMKALQIFTKNNNQWAGKPISEADRGSFLAASVKSELAQPISHASYLINLASPKPELWQKSVDSMVDELQRASYLNLAGVVMHPGSATDGDREAGLDRIAKGIDAIFKTVFVNEPSNQVKLLLENTAGQGNALGWQISDLTEIFRRSEAFESLGICIDSCHSHAAGYDLTSDSGLDRLVDELSVDSLLSRIAAIHLNDSKKPAGSRVDRHEHLGLGHLTLDGVARFINHPAFRSLPMILETEKGENEEGASWDVVNMDVAKRLYNS